MYVVSKIIEIKKIVITPKCNVMFLLSNLNVCTQSIIFFFSYKNKVIRCYSDVQNFILDTYQKMDGPNNSH